MKVQQLAPRTAIVATLKKHGKVKVGFLANQIGRNREETVGYLQSLEERGIVQREGDSVDLIIKDANRETAVDH